MQPNLIRHAQNKRKKGKSVDLGLVFLNNRWRLFTNQKLVSMWTVCMETWPVKTVFAVQNKQLIPNVGIKKHFFFFEKEIYNV